MKIRYSNIDKRKMEKTYLVVICSHSSLHVSCDATHVEKGTIPIS